MSRKFIFWPSFVHYTKLRLPHSILCHSDSKKRILKDEKQSVIRDIGREEVTVQI